MPDQRVVAAFSNYERKLTEMRAHLDRIWRAEAVADPVTERGYSRESAEPKAGALPRRVRLLDRILAPLKALLRMLRR